MCVHMERPGVRLSSRFLIGLFVSAVDGGAQGDDCYRASEDIAGDDARPRLAIWQLIRAIRQITANRSARSTVLRPGEWRAGTRYLTVFAAGMRMNHCFRSDQSCARPVA